MFISATGMVCPIGLTAATACAAKRAGVSAFKDLPYHDNAGEPIVGATVPGIKATFRGPQRLIELLTKSLTELLEAQPRRQWEEVPLLVGLAETERPGGGAGWAESVVKQAQEVL